MRGLWTTGRPLAMLAVVFVLLSDGCSRPPLRDVITHIPPEWPYSLTVPAVGNAQGMVASDAPLATASGVEILESGGNAVDAAVATCFTLAVVFPEAGNVGGGGFALVRRADGTVSSLDFRERAPLAAHASMYVDSLGGLTNGSTVGHLASGVPGSVAGLWELHRSYGVLPWPALLARAIELAERGFSVDERFVSVIRADSARLWSFPGSRALFFPAGRVPRAGEHWRNPDLAMVLRHIAARGADGFYRGEVATLLLGEMARGGGLISEADLQGYRAKWRTPVVFTYRGHRVFSMGPPSSGGITLAMIANMIEQVDVGGLGWGSSAGLHLLAEAMRRAFAVRNRYLGDPDLVAIPESLLVSKSFAALMGASIRDDRATPSAEISTDLPGAEGEHTTHLSIVDGAGSAVALTTTVNDLFGSGVTVTGAGFVLNNEMDDFTLRPGTANSFGLVQGTANVIAPGKRMLSAMTPTMLEDSSRNLLLVTGARGGPTIISAVAKIISNVVDHGLEINAAVRLPRIHHQHLPDTLRYEPNGFPPAVLEELRQRGHRLEARGYIGVAPSVMRRDSLWLGAFDPRVPGLARGPAHRASPPGQMP
jgi:gamma-glutamyltranspeptidase/glutathione hydrolase